MQYYFNNIRLANHVYIEYVYDIATRKQTVDHTKKLIIYNCMHFLITPAFLIT